MYLVYINYDAKADALGESMLIWLAGPGDVAAWCERDDYNFCTSKRFTIRTGNMKERYILGDFKDAYSACQFSKSVDKFVKKYGYDYVVKMATEFDVDLRRRALRSVNRKKLLASAVESALAEGAGRG
jgi:hypothetical protein